MTHIVHGIDVTIDEITKLFELEKSKIHKSEISFFWKKHISKKKYQQLNLNLKNFRNNRLSGGLDDDLSIEKLKNNFEVLKSKIDLKFLIKILLKSNVGNRETFLNLDEYFIDGNVIYEAYWLNELAKITDVLSTGKVFCDIGGGFGSFISKIKNLNVNASCLLIDLPESNLLSRYFLTKSFPDSTFLFTSDKKIDFKKFSHVDFIIVTPEVEILNINIDFVSNTRSMMEMSKFSIKNYFQFIQKNCFENSIFLNINAYTKLGSRNDDEIKFSEFPYDNNWDVLQSNSSFLQDTMHFLVTRRTLLSGNINEELKKISKKKEDIFKISPIIRLTVAKTKNQKKLILFLEYIIYYYRIIKKN